MKKTGYPLVSSTWDESEHIVLREVMDSGQFTMGKNVACFEQAFSQWVGAKYAVMVNSGSSANLLMIASLRFRKKNPLMPGDEVIVPAVSWSTTFAPLQQYGLRLKFVDVDSDTLNISIEKLSAAISDKTRAVLVVNLLGNPCDFQRLQGLVEGKDIVLLEDNCESMGAMIGEKHAGTFGLMGSFSTFFSHHICTMEGGIVVTDDEELYHILLSLRAHGWTRDLPKKNHVSGEKSDNPFEESFRFVLPGYNVRPLEMSGALGLKQLEKLPKLLERRRLNAQLFKELMANFPYLKTQTEHGSSSWFGFSIIITDSAPYDRNDLLCRFDSAAIESRPVVAGNFAKNPVMRWFDYCIHEQLSSADLIDSQGLFIGNHSRDLYEEMQLLYLTLNTMV